MHRCCSQGGTQKTGVLHCGFMENSELVCFIVCELGDSEQRALECVVSHSTD